MERALGVDGFFVGEPEDGLLALGALESLDGLETIPSLTFRAARRDRAAQRPGHVRRIS